MNPYFPRSSTDKLFRQSVASTTAKASVYYSSMTRSRAQDTQGHTNTQEAGVTAGQLSFLSFSNLLPSHKIAKSGVVHDICHCIVLRDKSPATQRGIYLIHVR